MNEKYFFLNFNEVELTLSDSIRYHIISGFSKERTGVKIWQVFN